MRPSVCVICMLSASFCVAVARFVICSSDENCAIWAMLSLSSDGFIGSWFFIWATISFRKSSLPRTFLSALALPAAAVAAAASVLVVLVVGSMAMVLGSVSGEDVDERAVGQLDRPVGDGQVGLGGVARGSRAAGGSAAAPPVARGGRAAVASAAALLVARGAGTGAGGVGTGVVDVDADDVHALRLERAAQL